jgi:hypothetical protein
MQNLTNQGLYVCGLSMTGLAGLTYFSLKSSIDKPYILVPSSHSASKLKNTVLAGAISIVESCGLKTGGLKRGTT